MEHLHGVIRRTIERAQQGEGTVRKLSPSSLQIHVANMKLNIWEPIDGEPVVSAPHNHTQGFTSTVLLGAIRNERLTLTEDIQGDWDLYTMTHIDQRRKMVFTPLGRRYHITRAVETLTPGTIYHCAPEEFHIATQAELTMTFLQLWGEAETPQYSLLPTGTHIDVVERYMPQDELSAVWQRVEAVCAQAGL